MLVLSKIITIALLALFVSSPYIFVQAQDSCTYNGVSFTTGNLAGTVTGGTYTLNLCSAVPCSSISNAAVCQFHSNDYFLIGSVGTGQWSTVSDGVVQYLDLATANPCHADDGTVVNRYAQVQFVCANTSSTTLTVDDTSGIHLSTEPYSCNFLFTINSPSACGFAPSSGGGGISGGWVFVIILVVSFFVYLCTGVAYQRFRKGASGTDLCPNKEFWKDLPSLMKDGCMFLVSKCRGKSGDSYSNI